ncbi:MAG: CBS domain-containing protein [Betaproteobacteria bacterium]|nr:MAG: CBS domain-containing protein [Betaproteobacteria bacterium]
MEKRFAPIASHLMGAGTLVRQPAKASPARVLPDDPALAVMTDLRQVAAVLVDPDVDIEAAQRIMIRRNVRSLFVVNVDNEVLGLITATDLLGEKPMQHLVRYGGRRSEIRVRDLMTPQARLEVLPMAAVERARVGHVVATLKAAGRQHAMVVEDDAQGHAVVRGVFSAVQLEKQLGETVATGAPARSFAEIEAALAH